MKSVTFRVFDPGWPSSRLRAAIPQRALAEVGVRQGRDVLVIGKHGWDWDVETCGYRRVVYDVCDSHWDDRWRNEVIDFCERADAVTCNSHVMADEIKAHTGRDAWVIPDPYEAPECEPHVGESLLWFGWHWNAQALQPWVPKLVGRELTILINGVEPHELAPGVRVVPWSPEAMDAEFQRAGLVILPTDMRPQAKSANRAIESIRRGVFPICGPLPAYSELGVWVGDIVHGVDWALSHRDEVVKRIRAAQEFVRWEFNPARIAKLWRVMLDTL
jgi:hypothetical protein